MGSPALEKIRMKHAGLYSLVTGILIVTALGCSTKFLKEKDPNAMKNDEFEKTVKIEEAPAAVVAPEIKPEEKPTKGSKKIAKKKSAKSKQQAAAAEKPAPNYPTIEDREGFNGRRPVVDPFRVGESATLELSYIGISAGTLTLAVDPFVTVNGHKSYNFILKAQSYPTFGRLVDAIDDKATTLMDFDQMIPRVYTLHVNETKQRKEGRSFFDFDSFRAKYWEKRVNEAGEVEEKNQDWEMQPWSQNVFSAIFYMRLFKWEIGKEYQFRVADDNQNIVFHGKALKKELLDTDIGQIKTIKIQPQFSVSGIFKPTGDIFIWVTDDDRKMVVRIEAKIKIGSLVGEVVKLDPGKQP